MSAQRRGHSDQSVQAGTVQASVLRLSGDLFGTAAERFRVGLCARVDERELRGGYAARHIGWQEQTLVLHLLRVQRLDDRDFAELHRRPTVRPELRGIRDRGAFAMSALSLISSRVRALAGATGRAGKCTNSP